MRLMNAHVQNQNDNTTKKSLAVFVKNLLETFKIPSSDPGKHPLGAPWNPYDFIYWEGMQSLQSSQRATQLAYEIVHTLEITLQKIEQWLKEEAKKKKNEKSYSIKCGKYFLFLNKKESVYEYQKSVCYRRAERCWHY